MKQLKKHTHGTVSCYRNGCRCSECKEAKRVQRQIEGHALLEHGYSKYSYGGCRCDVCVEGGYLYNAARKYGITQEEAIALRDIKSCDICGTEINTSTSKAGHIDHSHETGRVRGMLCQNCNNGLGHFKDNPDTMRLAIKYLRNI